MKIISQTRQTFIITQYECDECKGRGAFVTESSGTMPDICQRCHGSGVLQNRSVEETIPMRRD